MIVEEMLEEAVGEGHEDLQHLILFLVYEKKTLSLDDSSDKIQFYTQGKFSAKMNEFLSSYKKKLNAPEKTFVYTIITQKGTLYALAHSENEVRFLLRNTDHTIQSMNVLPDDYEMVEVLEDIENGIREEQHYTIRELKERAGEAPCILGGMKKCIRLNTTNTSV